MRRLKTLFLGLTLLLSASASAQVNLVEYEYWFNNDYASVQIVPITPTVQHELITGLDVSILADGVNLLNFRYKDENNLRSSTITKMFYKNTQEYTVGKQLVEYEYWFNNDYANVVVVPITPTAQHQLVTDLDVSILPEGVNMLNIRYKDEKNMHSSTLFKMFYKKENHVVDNRITAYRYWLDDDFVNAVHVSLQTPVNQLVLAEEIDLTQVPNGQYNIHFQFQDTLLVWSSVTTDLIEKESFPIADFSYAATGFCDSTVIDFTDISIDADTYLWSFGDGTTDTTATPSHTYMAANTYLVSLTVTDTITGADSTQQLSISTYGHTYSTLSPTACNSYTAPSGAVYTSSDTYMDTIANQWGCDSIITINATVNYPTTANDVITACDSHTWIDGTNYTDNNSTATYTLNGSNGCDSVVTLNLTINETPDTSITHGGGALTANATGAEYKWLDCNNGYSEIFGQTDQLFTAIDNGNYAVEVTDNGCTDTSSCYAILTIRILENSFGHGIALYPNPSDGNFTIDMGRMYDEIDYTITDTKGAVLQQDRTQYTAILPISINTAKGTYLIKVSDKVNEAVLRIVIR